MQEYTIETVVNGEYSDKRISICRIKNMNHTSSEGFSLLPKAGLCRADSNNPARDRTIEWYDENVLKPLIESGKISDGSKGGYDDRKMRYDKGIHIATNINPRYVIYIKFGHSHFLEYREKIDRTHEETEKLVELGNKHFQDPYAFFPRNPGVTGIILSSDKKIVVGPRNVEPDEYDGLLQGAAGHLTYKDNPKDVDLNADMLMELKEEVGIEISQVNRLEFLGLISEPSVAGDNLDFCYLINTDVHSDYFTSGKWKEKVGKPEHSDFYSIDSYDSLQKLVKTGNFEGKNFDIIFSTRGALASIEPKDFE